jgi:hypothetical protein
VHERFIEGNAAGVSYIYHAWQSVNNKANPTAWITHERNVAQSWQCVASRINTSLAHEGRTDRMHYLPAGLALARLVELATQGQVNGITGASTTETLNRLFADDVHLTELGQYYMALVTYASVFKVSPVGASYPASVSATQAASLQSLAWTTANAYRVDPMRPSMSECTAHARATFCPQISYYLNLPHELNNCVTGFSHASTVNPFYFNASVDPSYWLPAP